MSEMVERLALRLLEKLKAQPPASNYVVGDPAKLEDVLLDGHFDLKALARDAIDAALSDKESLAQDRPQAPLAGHSSA
jgi:hypothetical protein